MQGMIEGIKASDRFKDDFEARKEVYKVLYKMLEAGDWDNQDEPNGMDDAYDQLLRDEGIDMWSDEEEEEEQFGVCGCGEILDPGEYCPVCDPVYLR